MKQIKRVLLSILILSGVIIFFAPKAYARNPNLALLIFDGKQRTINGVENIEFTYTPPILNVYYGSSSENLENGGSIAIYNEAYIHLYEQGSTAPVFTQFISEDTIQFTPGAGDYIEIRSEQFGMHSMDIYLWKLEIEFIEPVDNMRPAFSGQENFVVNIDDPKPIEYFKSFLRLIDDVDGDITDRIVVETDNYTPNKSVLGTHTVVFSGTDNAGNTATLEVYVRVVDITAPVISSPAGNKGTIGYKETFNITAITNQLVVSDNYDSNLKALLKTDNYTPNKTKLGTYDLIYEATDNSGNTGTYTYKVQVIDNVKPTFSGPLTIDKPNNSIMLEREIREKITAYDEIDGNLTNRIKLIKDEYTGNGSKVGKYNITYEVSDNAGNKATHTITINVKDNLPPVFWIEDGVSIRVSKDTPLSRQQIIDLLTATGQLTVNSTTTFSFPLDEYTGNENKPGIYAMSIRARNTNGEESLHTLAINVLNDEKNDDDIIIEKEKLMEKILIPSIIIGGIALVSIIVISKKKK